MPLSRRTLVAALSAASLPAWAQAPAWPSKPLKILVGFPPGSSPDQTARALAEPLGQRLGVAVVVDNKPGAAGNIAADLVAKAADDHTLGLLINGNLTIAKLLNPATPFDPARDFAPVGLIGSAPLVLAASAILTSPGRSTLVPELASLRAAGVNGAELEIWNAMAAPASFPKPALAKLSATLAEVVRTPEMRQRLFQLGWQAVGGNGEALALRMQADTALLGGIIRAQGIKAE